MLGGGGERVCGRNYQRIFVHTVYPLPLQLPAIRQIASHNARMHTLTTYSVVSHKLTCLALPGGPSAAEPSSACGAHFVQCSTSPAAWTTVNMSSDPYHHPSPSSPASRLRHHHHHIVGGNGPRLLWVRGRTVVCIRR